MDAHPSNFTPADAIQFALTSLRFAAFTAMVATAMATLAMGQRAENSPVGGYLFSVAAALFCAFWFSEKTLRARLANEDDDEDDELDLVD